MAFRRLKLGPSRIQGANVQLVASEVADEGPIWIQVALAGNFKGYSGGELKFDAVFFNKVIANFHAHPWYQAGADGIGCKRVVPYDYEHASEMDPTSGSIPQNGAGAPAWALELQLRTDAEGVAQLWALTEPVSDEVRMQLKTGAYLSTSVCIWKDAIDGVTGNKIGPVLTSVAFTNHPFIKGMEQIAARVEVWGEAESAEELIVGLRDILELDETATADIVGGALSELGAAFMEGRTYPGYPEGVGCILDQVRRLIGLRKLASAPEIIAAAGQALTVVPNTKPTTTPSPAPGANQMSATNLTTRLSAVLKCRDHDDAIMLAAEEAAAATDALTSLQTLLGSSDTQDMLKKAKALIDMADKYRDTVNSLAAANDTIGKQDAEAAEGEVDQVAASLKLNGEQLKRMRPMLLSQRIEAGRRARDTTAPDHNKDALTKWRTDNGISLTANHRERVLTSEVVAGRGGVQFGSRETAHTEESQTQPHPLESYPGPNRTEKARAYLTEKRPGFSKLTRSEQVFQAGQYLQSGAPPVATVTG